MNCESIRQKLLNIDYGINSSSLILLVPGLSLIAQKVQTSHLMDQLAQGRYRPDQVLTNPEYTKLNKVYKYHFFGSLIQTITFLVLSILHPLFMLPAISSIYELYCSGKALHHVVISWENGSIQIRH